MHRAQEQVRDFHRAMGLPCPSTLRAITPKQMRLRLELIREEFQELQLAAGSGLDPRNVDSGTYIEPTAEMIDALCDLLYTVYGFGVEIGADLQPFFELVHEANMKKGPGPMRADGKKLKPPGWTPPDHTDELMAQKEKYDGLSR